MTTIASVIVLLPSRQYYHLYVANSSYRTTKTGKSLVFNFQNNELDWPMAGIFDTGIFDTNIFDTAETPTSLLPTMTPIKMADQVPILIVRQGESLPFEFDLDGDSISGWICTINVRTVPKETVVLTQVIPPSNNNSWVGYLTSTQTSLLETGTYRLTGVLSNATTDEEKQIPVRFTVSQPWG